MRCNVGEAARGGHADIRRLSGAFGAVASSGTVVGHENPVAGLQVALHRAVGEGEVVAPAVVGAGRAALVDALHGHLALVVVPLPVVALHELSAAAVGAHPGDAVERAAVAFVQRAHGAVRRDARVARRSEDIAGTLCRGSWRSGREEQRWQREQQHAGSVDLP